uniref:DUF5641 domain-containing protein n=1 Tax=Anopheles stephensi TaxID=30069 RepID=A0A182YMW6_ANOST
MSGPSSSKADSVRRITGFRLDKQWITLCLTKVQLPSEIHRKLRGLNERAAGFLNSFVKKFGEIYGREHLSSDVLNLQHIVQDVYQYGPLDEFSTYCFENHLQIIKRSVRSGFRCGVQLAARAEERSALDVASTSSNRRYPRLTTNGKNWKTVQARMNGYWRKWVKLYQPTLTRRTKWFEPHKPIQPRDIVLIVDENTPRNCWPRGKVDSVIRRVVVRTARGTTLEKP